MTEPTLKRSGSRDFDVDDYSPHELAQLRKVLRVYLNGERVFAVAACVAAGWVEEPLKIGGVPMLGPRGDLARVRKHGVVEIVMADTGHVYRA